MHESRFTNFDVFLFLVFLGRGFSRRVNQLNDSANDNSERTFDCDFYLMRNQHDDRMVIGFGVVLRIEGDVNCVIRVSRESSIS